MEKVLRFELFGGFRILADGNAAPRLRSEKPQALLAFLAAHPDRHHSREVLMEMLWPDAELDAARNRLNVSLSRIRDHLADLGEEARWALCSDRSYVWLDPAQVETDVDEFHGLIERASKSYSQHERADLLQAAVTLYRGILLPGFYDDWVSVEQERLRERFNRAATDLIRALETDGRLEDAIEASRHVCSVDPLLEEAHKDLIRLLMHAGRKAEALQQYRLLEHILREQLDSEPSEATHDLVRELRNGDGAALRLPTPRELHAPRSFLAAPASVMPVSEPASKHAVSQTLSRPFPTRWIGAAVALTALMALTALRLRTDTGERTAGSRTHAASTEAGKRLWMASYQPDPDERDSEPRALASDSAGNIYVAAVVETVKDDADILILKYSPDGRLLWRQRYNDRAANDCDRPTHLSVDGAGNVVVLGESYTGDRGQGSREWDLIVLKYSSNGLRRWSSRIDDGRRQDDRPAGMGIDSAGNVYLAGTSTANKRDARFLIEKIDPNGNLLWRDLFIPERLPMSAENWAAGSFHVDASGSSVLTGAGVVADASNRSTEDLLTIRYDRHGTKLWHRRYTSDRAGSTRGRVVAVDHHQNIYVAGTFRPVKEVPDPDVKFVNEEVVVVKYDRHGEEVWSTHIEERREQVYVRAITVDAQGRPYVLSASSGNSMAAVSTLWSLSDAGAILWEDRCARGGTGIDCAMDGDGVVYAALETLELDPAGHPSRLGMLTTLIGADKRTRWVRREPTETWVVKGGILHQDRFGKIISGVQEPVKGKQTIRLYAYSP